MLTFSKLESFCASATDPNLERSPAILAEPPKQTPAP
jgi:hypothetical protein